MSYYARRVQQLSSEVYGKDYLLARIIQAKKFIDKYFAERIDLGKIATEAHLSKFHFMRSFKTYYGRTPHQYLIDVRIRKAKEFLNAGSTVADVCICVGFDSIPSFTRVFKKITGTTPAHFQSLKRKSNFG